MEESEEAAGTRRRSKVEMYAHVVWATKNHCPVLTPEWERTAHRCIIAETGKLRCDVFAIGGMPDHVHLVVRLAGDIGPSKLAKQVKGASSYLLNTLRDPGSEFFRWQDGFAAFSLDKKHLAQAIRYVQTQREHHANNKQWPFWEETDEPSLPASRSASNGR